MDSVGIVYGAYVLVLEITSDLCIRVGSLGFMCFPRGFYFYVGSACGSGGVMARVRRHLRREKRVFWHIDYLTIHKDVFVKAFLVIPSDCSVDYETIVSNVLLRHFPIACKGFGSSDKSDISHLFRCPHYSLDKCINVLYSVLRENDLTVRIYYTTDLYTS